MQRWMTAATNDAHQSHGACIKCTSCLLLVAVMALSNDLEYRIGLRNDEAAWRRSLDLLARKFLSDCQSLDWQAGTGFHMFGAARVVLILAVECAISD